MDRQGSGYDAYVPRVASEWDAVAPGSLWRGVVGSLVFVDISGFTNLAERLAERGRIGAEELTAVLDRVFGRMLDRAYERGGGLLKFGGDALLLLFDSDDHVLQAVASAVEMRSELRSASQEKTSVGRIDLKMSVGVHTGAIDFFLVGSSHRELLVGGPVASETVEMEGLAAPGEIVVSDAVRHALPVDFTGDPKGTGWLFRKRVVDVDPAGLIQRTGRADETMVQYVSKALRSHLAARLSDSEHRIGTVGFVKFSGLDALIAEVGPEETGRRLDRLVSVIQGAADGEDVTFLASDVDADGGKVILTAGVPTSGHDDEGRVLRAARRILDADLPLNVRIGVNRGHVFAGEVGTEVRRTYTVMGDTVNLAARLMAAAPYGGLLATPGVLDRSSTLFRTEKLEPFSVKGKEQPVQSFAVFEATGRRTSEDRRELPFTGRERELDEVHRALTTGPRAATIIGETGIGKSRLVAEVLQSLEQSSSMFVQAEPNSSENAYWAFRDPMRRHLGIQRRSQREMASDLGDRISAAAPHLLPLAALIGDVLHIDMPDSSETRDIEPRFRLDRTADALVALLEATTHPPFGLVVEDAHWLDSASSALVERVHASLGDSREWWVLQSSRPGDAPVLGERVLLAPLEDAAVRSLVVSATAAFPLRPRDLDAIVERVGGNPLFLDEILRLVRSAGSVDDLPESLDEVVTSEIDTLPTLARQLLRYAAVLGRSFRKVVLEEFLAPEQVELDRATRRLLARYIQEDGPTRWRFRHAIVQSVAYEGLAFGRRQQLHLRAGEVVERLAGEDTEAVAEFLAFHFSLARAHDRAFAYAVIAGDRSRDRYLNVEAAKHYQLSIDAARHLDSIDAEEVARLYEEMGDVSEMASLYEDADRAYQAARGLRDGDPDATGRLMAKQGLLREKAGKLPAALAWFRRGMNLMDDAGSDGSAKPELMVAYGGIRFRQGKYERAVGWCEAALDHPAITDDERAHALYLLVTLYAHLGRPEASRAGERAIEIFERTGDLVGMGNVLNNLGVDAYFRGNWNEALDLYERSGDARERAGDVVGAAASVNNVAEIYSDQGKLEEAVEGFRRALYVWESAGFSVGVALASINLGRALTRSGRFEEARVNLERGRRSFEEMGADSYVHETRLRLAELDLYAGRSSEAVEAATQLLGVVRDDDATLMLRAALHRIRGYCARSDADAEDWLRASLKCAERANSRFEVALTLEALARRLASHPDATGWTERQSDLLEHLGVIATPVTPLPADMASTASS